MQVEPEKEEKNDRAEVLAVFLSRVICYETENVFVCLVFKCRLFFVSCFSFFKKLKREKKKFSNRWLCRLWGHMIQSWYAYTMFEAAGIELKRILPCCPRVKNLIFFSFRFLLYRFFRKSRCTAKVASIKKRNGVFRFVLLEDEQFFLVSFMSFVRCVLCLSFSKKRWMNERWWRTRDSEKI